MEKTKKPFLSAIAGIVALSMLALMPAPGSAATFEATVPSQEYLTIQAGIDAAAEAIKKAADEGIVIDGIVLVAEGIYEESIVMESGVTVQGSGADVTKIQGDGTSKYMYMVIGAPNSTISGFTITGAYYYGIYNGSTSSPTITNNIITGNRRGIYNNSYSSPTITNNIISGSKWEGIYNLSKSSPTITNNIISGNAYDGISNLSNSSPTITNNIISGNMEYGIESLPESSPVIEYNDVFGNSNTLGDYYPDTPLPPASNISVDPMFVDAGNGDYHLQEGSPCIDAGTNDALGLPETDADGNPRIVDGGHGGPIVDMGAFEYQVEVPDVANAPMECFKVNYVKVIDGTRHGTKRDKIKIRGSLKLAEEAESFDPGVDAVKVTINDEVFTIEESFKEKHFLWLHYYCFRGDIDGVRVHMHLDFNRCRWWVKIYGMEASDLVQSETATVNVNLTIGKNVGDDSFELIKRWKGRRMGFASFMEWPPERCCGRWRWR